MPRSKLDLMGQRFGLLTVIAAAPKDGHHTAWKCLCSCGAHSVVWTVCLRRITRPVRSCGCLKLNAEYNVTHGMKGSREYSTWAAMLSRCRNPNVKEYPYYGGAGIRVCKRWLSFKNFLADLGLRPEGMSIDRFPNNEGNYEPGNCRWATPKQQANNRKPPQKRKAA